MRLLRVNGQDVDLDDKTAIGVTFQALDLKDPGKRKVKYTNTFNIPATAKNRNIFGHPGNPHSIDQIVYDSLQCDYWDSNLHVIKNGRIRVEEASDRISLFVIEKPDVWEAIKLLTFKQFSYDFFQWLQIPKAETPFVGSFTNFVSAYANATEGVYLPLFYSNLYGVLENNQYVEDTNRIVLNHNSKSNGGHFTVFYKTIFEFIEEKYGVNFMTGGGVVPGNIWDDQFAKAAFHSFRSLTVAMKYDTGGNVIGYYFLLPDSPIFMPHEDTEEMGGKSLYDVVNCFFQHFNILIDEIELSASTVIRLARWDDIQNAEVVDWSGGVVGYPKFRPRIDGYAQENKIKFSSIYPDGSEDVNCRILKSLNKNLDAKVDLFEIDSYIPASIVDNGPAVLDLSVPESFETNVFMVNSGNKRAVTVVLTDGYSSISTGIELNIAAVYSLSGEYQFLESAIKYPKYYELTKWLTIYDIIGIEFFKQYWIQELGASFFINKIPGFNPSKGKQAVKLELFKISDTAPVYPDGIDYYTDGIGDYWTDGTGDYYF